MVQTRNQWRQWINNPSPQFRAIPFPSELLSQDSIPDLDWMIPNAQGSDDLCEECSQGETRENSTTGPYRDNDFCKRHRKKDDEPYTVQVTPYSRRKPRS